MADVWGSFGQGLRLGDAMRTRAREDEQRSAYGSAFQRGGFGAVAQTAGGMGDLETAGDAQTQVQQQEESGIQRAQRNATVLGNVATSLTTLPYEQRRQRIEQMAPMLTELGLEPEQLQGFDPTDEALASVRAVQGQFSQYVDITERGNQVLGIKPDGSVDVLHTAPNTSSASGAQYDTLTPEEVEAEGLPPGSYQRNQQNRQISVIGRTRGQYTDSAAAAGQFAARMQEADATLQALEESVDPALVYAGQYNGGDQDVRRVRQAQREFLNAILRKESGAVISPEEFRSGAMQYFPVPGDGPEVIAQKRAARRRSIQGLMNASQGAYEEWYGEGSGVARPPPVAPTGSSLGALAGGGGAPAAPAPGEDDDPIAAIDRQLEELDAMERQQGGGR